MGEVTNVNEGNIEQRAEKLETDQQAAAAKAEADAKAAENKAPEGTPAATPPAAPVAQDKKPPEGDKELRKWATRLSMENAEIKKQLESLASTLSKAQQKKVDWKELAKDPAKLEKAIEERENELIKSHQTELNERLNQSVAELTATESERRGYDAVNYPRWNELLPVIRKLATPNEAQPNGDTRINFNQPVKAVLDDLYELAQDIVKSDPNYKPPIVEKTYSQKEFDEALAKAKADALADQATALKNENRGAGVAGMGKGAAKGKPGEVDKEALWNMPLADLKSALQKASDR